MRSYRLIFLLALLLGCKATSKTSSVGLYKEDLSVHRPSLDIAEVSNEITETKHLGYVPLSGHLKHELDSISRFSVAENKNGKKIDGFAIQVYSGNNREMANNTRALCFKHFPELKPRVTYHQPNFRVRAGRFITRIEANKVYEEVKKEFPKALLIPDRFNLLYE